MCNDHLNVAFIYQNRCVHVSLIENWLWPKTKLRSTMHFTWTLKYIWEKATTTATDRKKSRARLAKQQLCTCIRLFCTFLCRFCMTWTWNFLLFLYLDQSLRIDSTENFANVRKIEWNAARVMKLETARIRFSSDVFTAVVRSRLLKLHIKKGEISSKFGTLLRNGMYHVKRNNGKKWCAFLPEQSTKGKEDILAAFF